MANLGDLGNIAGIPRFQGRVAEALAESAAAVYSEAGFAATISSTAQTGAVLNFAAVPGWVVAGGGVADLTTPAAISTAAIIVGVTATTVSIGPAVLTGGVKSGDVIVFQQHAARASFANRVANGNYQIMPMCHAVLGNATIASAANINTLPDYGIADTDIAFAVTSLWALLSNA